MIRAMARVRAADACLIFTMGSLHGNARRAVLSAERSGKPWCHIDILRAPRTALVRDILKWLNGLPEPWDYRTGPRAGTLYVTGNRDHSAPNIGDYVFSILVEVLRQQTLAPALREAVAAEPEPALDEQAVGV